MSKAIVAIAKQYPHLNPERISRNSAFGVVYNNTSIGGKRLSAMDNGKRVTSQVLRQLGYVDTVDLDVDVSDI